jgi:hypothetical protein
LKETLQDIYLIGNLKEPLLGRPAIDALNLVQKVETIQADESRLIEDEVKNPPIQICSKAWESWMAISVLN